MESFLGPIPPSIIYKPRIPSPVCILSYKIEIIGLVTVFNPFKSIQPSFKGYHKKQQTGLCTGTDTIEIKSHVRL